MALHKEALKLVVGTARRPIARHRMVQTIDRAPRPYRIEIGAAGFLRPGWVGGDINWRTRTYMDALSRWPFPDQSASHVYADNVIEHLNIHGNRVLFREAFRVLQDGGRIRLVTPDIGRLARLYLENGDEARWHLENAGRSGYEAHHAVDLLRIVFQEAGHHLGYLWDLDALTAELTDAGFQNVTRAESGVSDDSAFINLETRKEGTAGETSVVLIVEADRKD